MSQAQHHFQSLAKELSCSIWCALAVERLAAAWHSVAAAAERLASFGVPSSSGALTHACSSVTPLQSVHDVSPSGAPAVLPLLLHVSRLCGATSPSSPTPAAWRRPGRFPSVPSTPPGPTHSALDCPCHAGMQGVHPAVGAPPRAVPGVQGQGGAAGHLSGRNDGPRGAGMALAVQCGTVRHSEVRKVQLSKQAAAGSGTA